MSKVVANISTPQHGATSIDAAAISALNGDARKALAEEVDKLLRIRREADEAAFRLIELLDLDEIDPDLEDNGDAEPTIGWTAGEAAYGRIRNTYADDGEFEPSLGWTAGANQSGRAWLGRPHAGAMWNAVPDGEAEHDGREPSLGAPEDHLSPYWGRERNGDQTWWGVTGNRHDLEEQCEDEGTNPGEDDSDAKPNPAYYARLRARRRAGKAVQA